MVAGFVPNKFAHCWKDYYKHWALSILAYNLGLAAVVELVAVVELEVGVELAAVLDVGAVAEVEVELAAVAEVGDLDSLMGLSGVPLYRFALVGTQKRNQLLR